MSTSTVTIRTNNVPREVLNRWELTPEESAEFDYLGDDEGSFFRYRGDVYDLGEFSRIIAPGAESLHPMECAEPASQGWDGYVSDSFFSGMLVRWARDENGRVDAERVIVGLYCS